MPCSKTPVETRQLAILLANLLPSAKHAERRRLLLFVQERAYPMSTIQTRFGAQSHGLYPYYVRLKTPVTGFAFGLRYRPVG